MGARFRLRSSYNISSFSPTTQVVLRAFQHYGLVLADNGSDWFFGGTTDDWWGTTAGSQVVSELKTIPAAHVDALHQSSLQAAAGPYPASRTHPLRPSAVRGQAPHLARLPGRLPPPLLSLLAGGSRRQLDDRPAVLQHGHLQLDPHRPSPRHLLPHGLGPRRHQRR